MRKLISDVYPQIQVQKNNNKKPYNHQHDIYNNLSKNRIQLKIKTLTKTHKETNMLHPIKL
ncbi:hypothetical protein, partial [Pseudoalteromonas piscicida]